MSIRLLLLAALLVPALPGRVAQAADCDASNGFFGPGSHTGSDHWLASLLQAMLLEEATPGGVRQEARRDDSIWVKPAPDRCWKRPPILGGRYGAPGSDGGHRAPVSDGTYTSPVSDGKYRSPVSDGKYRSPTSDGKYVSPRSDGRFESPRSDGELRAPSGEPEEPVPPRCEKAPPAPGGEEDEDDVQEPGKGDSLFRRPRSDDSYRPPSSVESGPRVSRNPGRGKAVRSCTEAADGARRCVVNRDIDGAIEGYRRAISLAGRNDERLKVEARLGLGTALLARQQVCEAAEVLRRLIQVHETARARLLLGMALLFQGDVSGAHEQFARSPGKKSDGVSTLLLAVTADMLGRRESALKGYAKHLKSGDDLEVRRRWAELGGYAPATPGAGLTAGEWRILSSRIFYDRGGAGALGDKVFRRLEISGDGTWKLGSSTGKWRIEPIGGGDWILWKVASFGPTRKVVLSGWNGGTASGPIEESNGAIDFFWVIYHVEPPTVQAPGDVHMKLGRG